MKKDEISQERQDYALRTALATVRLEGQEPSQEAKNLATKVANGEITSSEAIEFMKMQHSPQEELNELLAHSPQEKFRPTDEDREWVEAKPVGREI